MDSVGRGGAAVGAFICFSFGVLVAPILNPSFGPAAGSHSAGGAKWEVHFTDGHVSVSERQSSYPPPSSVKHNASDVLGAALSSTRPVAQRPVAGASIPMGPASGPRNTDEACFIKRMKQLAHSKEDLISWRGQNLIEFDDMFDVSNVFELFALPGENASAKEVQEAIIELTRKDDHKELNRRRWANGRSKADLPALRKKKLIIGGDVKSAGGLALCPLTRLHQHIGVPYVFIFGFNENWGGLSTELPCESTTWGSLYKHSRRQGCTMRQLMDFVDEPDVLGIVTAQHQHPLLSRPGKTWSIPLGTRHPEFVWPIIDKPPPLPQGTKPRLMLMSLSDWEFRKAISAAVTGNSDGAIKKDGKWSKVDFFEQIYLSKYVLVAAGMGWDTYRGWETLMAGSIPVMRASRGVGGMLHSYGWSPDGNHSLPILWINDWQEVHPDLLKQRYMDIVARCHEYDLSRLTKKWWRDTILGLFDKAAAR